MGERRKAKLLHVETLVYDSPLAVARPRLDAICDVLDHRDDPAALEAAVVPKAEASDEATITTDGVAVLPIMGTFVKRAGMMDALSGLQSYDAIAKSFRALVENPSVRGIVLQIDSPGGQVAGMFDLAAEFVAARKKKPLWAIADENALSAGYLMASAAEKVFVPSTGWLGSIGVRAVRRDDTVANEQAGRRRIHIASGSQKLDGEPDLKPTDKELARLKAKVDQMASLFFEAVGANRGMTVEAVAALEAGTFIGTKAVDAGLADDVATLGEVVARMTAHVTGREPVRPAASAPQTAHAAMPQRRDAMAENGTGSVVSITDHPDYKQTIEGVSAAAAEHVDQVSTLVVLAIGATAPDKVPAQIQEFLGKKTPLADIRAWATAERAKALAPALATVTGVHPAATAPKPKGFAMTSEDVFAKRARELEDDRAKNPIIKRICAVA